MEGSRGKPHLYFSLYQSVNKFLKIFLMMVLTWVYGSHIMDIPIHELNYKNPKNLVIGGGGRRMVEWVDRCSF